MEFVSGLFKSEKKRANCTGIADLLQSSNHQSLNHLLTGSKWSFRAVLKDLAVAVSSCLEGYSEVALMIDEVSFRKKGLHSACVGHQYLGCIGKADIGQVAVVAALSAANLYCPVDVNLFMPQSWSDDRERCHRAGIPDSVNHRSKTVMALEMILKARQTGIRFDYAVFDALYGGNHGLLEALVDSNIPFIGDAKSNIRVFFSPPNPIPKRGQKRQDTALRDYFSQLDPGKDFQEISLRKGAKGDVSAKFHSVDVWLITNPKTRRIVRLRLLIRVDNDGEVRYALSNMLCKTTKQLARMQGQRIYVERVFEEGKNQVGMGDYQVRSWEGFHRHITLSFLALYVIMKMKLKTLEKLELTAPMIRKLIAATIKGAWESLPKTLENILKWEDAYQKQKDTLRNPRAG